MEFIISNKINTLPNNISLNNNLKISCSKKLDFVNFKKKKFIFFGHIEGFYVDGKLSKTKSLKNILSKFPNLRIDKILNNIEGRFLIVCLLKNEEIKIYQDRFGKYDLFYKKDNNNIFLSNNFKFIVKEDNKKININATALTLNTYATRPAKKDTIFENISRLGVGEHISIKKNKFILTSNKFTPNKSENYPLNKIKDYFDIFVDYLKNNDGEKNKIIFLSSGFDSSYLTALLTKIFNKKNIFGLTCIQKFNDRSGIYNRFEIERVKKLSKFYGNKNYFIDVNLKDHFEKMSEEISNISGKRMLFNQVASFMHHVLSKKSKELNLGKSVYSGEISDGMHNMGFSQLVSSTDNTSYGFREYADKKTNYLYSPSFQTQILNNKYYDDKIFIEFFKKKNYTPINKKYKNYPELVKEIFYNQFLSYDRLILDNRIPLLLKKSFFNEYKKYYNDNYFKNVKINSPEQFYSSIQHLYNSFHWQGSTVSTMSHFPIENNLHMHFPFWNIEIQNFIDKMPENWGRGLELRPTKFPLKESFKKYLNFPSYLEKGPHSYMYDVNKFVSPKTEVLINSKTKKYILKIIKKYHPLEFLDNNNFNHSYINNVIKGYQKGSEKKAILENCEIIWNLYSFSKMMHDLDL